MEEGQEIHLLSRAMPALPTKVLTDKGTMQVQLKRAPRPMPNGPCPCNSGAKFKKCCGRQA